MARKATGQVVERMSQRGLVFALRFRAYGKRHYFTLGTASEGWTRQKAAVELENVLADVRRGIWREPEPEPRPAEPERAPTFAEYANAWLDLRRPELRRSTFDDYRWSLGHLLPVFGDLRLDEIRVSDVDRFKAAKVTERQHRLVKRPLSNVTINKALTRLAQILDYAVEDGFIERNPAKGRRRRLKEGAPRRTWLDTSDQLAALLDAAGRLDRRVQPGRDRAVVATLMFAGLRISELLALRRGDVDLATGRLRVRRSKTAAGQRDVNLLPVLRDELSAYLARVDLGPGELVFGTGAGEPDNPSNIRNRVLKPAVDAANEELGKRGVAQLPERVTPHSLRRTFASVLVSIGEDPVYAMSQLGHTDPQFTLRVYAQVMQDRGGERERIKALVNGADWAPMGTKPRKRVAGANGRGVANSRKAALQAGF